MGKQNGQVGKAIYRRDRSWSEGAVHSWRRYKEPRGYLGVDSNDGARGALRQISSPIATKVGITFRTLSYTPVYRGFARTSSLFVVLPLRYRHPSFSLAFCPYIPFRSSFLSISVSLVFSFFISLFLLLFLPLTNTKADNGEKNAGGRVIRYSRPLLFLQVISARPLLIFRPAAVHAFARLLLYIRVSLPLFLFLSIPERSTINNALSLSFSVMLYFDNITFV